jgi:hypothetical protein
MHAPALFQRVQGVWTAGGSHLKGGMQDWLRHKMEQLCGKSE